MSALGLDGAGGSWLGFGMSLQEFLNDTTERLYEVRSKAAGPVGRLPLTESMLRDEPSGHLFGLSQNVGMGWDPSEVARDPYLILSTQGGLRAPDGSPVALGYHTGHWEISELVRAAAVELRELKKVPFAAYVSDPCDGRTQGTVGMFDSLPYRNDAAIVFRRLIRSLPVRRTALFIEESLYRGTQWVVFEPNDEPLWAQIRLNLAHQLPSRTAPRVTAIQDDRDIVGERGQFCDQFTKLPVFQIIHIGGAAIVTDERFVHAIWFGPCLIDGLAAMTTKMQDDGR